MKAVLCFLSVLILSASAGSFRNINGEPILPLVAVDDLQTFSVPNPDKFLHLVEGAWKDSKEVVDAWKSWKSADFSDGDGILLAIQDTSKAFLDTYKTIDDASSGEVQQEAIRAAEFIVGGSFPEAVVAIEAGRIVLTLASQSKDITDDVECIYNGFKNEDASSTCQCGFNLILMMANDFF